VSIDEVPTRLMRDLIDAVAAPGTGAVDKMTALWARAWEDDACFAAVTPTEAAAVPRRPS